MLDELLEKRSPTLTRLVVAALAQAANQHPVLIQSKPFEGMPEPGWRPNSWKEYFTCFEQALRRLIKIAEIGKPELQDDLRKAAGDFAWYLRSDSLRETVASFYEAVRDAYPATREPLRRFIADLLQGDKKHREDLSAEGVEAIEQLHSRFEDSTLSGRLQQHVGQTTWDPEDRVDLTPLATERHWESLADQLAEVADRTSLLKLRRWARKVERSIRNMAEREKERELEEELRDN